MTPAPKRRPPGIVPPDAQPDVEMMICTAGHVDHGKTRLVRLLTGCSTDRLKAERERGLTIELGFAPCFLGGNRCIGIVDVPGHEKFVRTMVSGVSGIDMAVLVIAADDGVMPQTVEHFHIMDLMGVRHGLVALTKIDLVSDEDVQRRTEEIRAFAAGTWLETAPICPVSAETLDGLAELHDTLIELAARVSRPSRDGVFRMPIERAFSREGFGTVITGIPVAGSVSVGDELELVPGGMRGRVRGMQCFLRDATEGGRGQCLALNLSGLGKPAPVRGQVACRVGYLQPARLFHLRIRAVPGIDPPLRNAEQVKLHTGTAEAPGKVYLLEGKTLSGGESALVTVAVTDEMCAAPGDRVILRRPSPAGTAAGGEILIVSQAAARPRKREALLQLQDYEGFMHAAKVDGRDAPAPTVEYCLLSAGAGAVSARELPQRALVTEDAVRRVLGELVDGGRAVPLGAEVYVHREVYDDCLQQGRARIEELRKAGELGIAVRELPGKAAWADALLDRVADALARDGDVLVRDGRLVLTSTEGLAEAERGLMVRLVLLYEETGFQSPAPRDLPAMLGQTPAAVEKVLQLLYDTRRLVRLSGNVVLGASHFRHAQDLVVKTIKEDGVLDSGEFKLQIGSTRKYALAILDFLDLRNVTVRMQNRRKLHTAYEKNLI